MKMKIKKILKKLFSGIKKSKNKIQESPYLIW